MFYNFYLKTKKQNKNKKREKKKYNMWCYIGICYELPSSYNNFLKKKKKVIKIIVKDGIFTFLH